MSKCVALIGAFNTKSKELHYMQDCLEKKGLSVITVDLSCLEYALSDEKIDFSQKEVALRAGFQDINDIYGWPLYKAAPQMSSGAYQILTDLIAEKKIHGCIGIGGANGTLLASSVMEQLPLGFPKIIISVMAAVDTRRLISHTDIVLFNTIGDAVLNPVLKVIIENASSALQGMVQSFALPDLPKMIGITVLGVTDPCVLQCIEILDQKELTSLLLHSNGPGGATLEKMIVRDAFWAIIDTTTNELLNNMLGGVFDAGPNRLENALEKGLPLVVSTGAVDFVNFWGTQVPEQFKKRTFLRHNVLNTLMRTDISENRQLGHLMAGKLNKAKVPVRVLIPGKGFSKYDREGGPKSTDLDGKIVGDWYWPEANQAFAAALSESIKNPLVKVLVKEDLHINDYAFSQELVQALLEITGKN